MTVRLPFVRGDHRVSARGDDRGAVVAELAVALPAVAAILLLGAGALGACATQVRLQDAAADAARLAARGEDRARVSAAGADVGGVVSLGARGDLVCATVSASGPVGIGELAATSCALDGGR